jgi:hypothetical protein
MVDNRAVPVVVGVGDIKNPFTKAEDAIEPMHLMLQAIGLAIEDTTLTTTAAAKLHSNIDSLDVVRTWTWAYPDLPALLAQNLGIKPWRKFYSEQGGNQPAKLLDEAARRISFGETKVVLITGGEALASCTKC